MQNTDKHILSYFFFCYHYCDHYCDMSHDFVVLLVRLLFIKFPFYLPFAGLCISFEFRRAVKSEDVVGGILVVWRFLPIQPFPFLVSVPFLSKGNDGLKREEPWMDRKESTGVRYLGIQAVGRRACIVGLKAKV